MKHTTKEAQEALNRAGVGPIDPDGNAGPQTAEAVTKYQTKNGLAVTGLLDEPTLAKLFPASSGPKGIQATIQDWIINAVTSKINGVALALVAVVVAWIQTKFGFNVPQDIQNNVTMLLVAAFAAAIGYLRTFLNTPHVSAAKPAVILNPGEFH